MRAVVIGGSGGVGRVICVALARAGFDVVLTYRKNAAAAEEAARAVREAGRSAEVRAVDLAEVPSALFEGPVDLVVHAVGSDIPMRFVSQIDPRTFKDVIDQDVQGFFHVVRAALPRLRESKGSIVALTSAGLRRYPTKDILSVAPKAAIEALVRGVAVEEGRFGVRANCVALGVIDAGIFHRLDFGEEWIEAARRNTPLRRFGTAEEVADAVLYLARASYVTGQTISVDGGYSI